MSLIINDHDRTIVAELLERNIISEINPDDYQKMQDGSVAVVCADGDQYYFTYNALTALAMHHRTGQPRIHPLNRNGGILSMNRKKVDRESLVGEIQESPRLKGVRIILVVLHVPCAVAYGNKWSLHDVINFAIADVQYLYEHGVYQEIKFLLQVDFDHNNKKLFAFNEISYLKQ